jgi:mono/diheme cytochrome c family protein
MAPVVRNLAGVPDGDVRAISTYVAVLAGAPTPMRVQIGNRAVARAGGEPPVARGTPDPLGRDLYVGACAQCHGEAGRVPLNPALHLTLSSTLRTPQPDNAIRIVREGVHAPDSSEPVMPGFANVFNDAQTRALLSYLRLAFTESPVWTDIDAAMRRVRSHDADKQATQLKASLP